MEASAGVSAAANEKSAASAGASARTSAAGSGSPWSTLATASESSGSMRVSVTSEMPMGGRLAVPLKMQSDMRSARSILWLCSPSTQEMASTTLDLPQPFGPTMHVMPLPLNVIGVFSQNDLKPRSSTLRSFSTRPSHVLLPLRHPQKEVLSEFLTEVRSRQKRTEGSIAMALPPGAFESAVTGIEISTAREACKARFWILCIQFIAGASSAARALAASDMAIHPRAPSPHHHHDRDQPGDQKRADPGPRGELRHEHDDPLQIAGDGPFAVQYFCVDSRASPGAKPP